MALHELRPPKGSVKRKKRIARGIGSGKGKTATRGTKGQKARRQINPVFEGGQTPIHRRLPVKKGFRNVKHVEYAVINLDDLETHFAAGSEVTPEALQAKGIVGALKDGVKVLGFGELKKKLKVKAHKFSKAAAEKIAAAGGEVSTL
jgi:large subunit ribosomal protein L15